MNLVTHLLRSTKTPRKSKKNLYFQKNPFSWQLFLQQGLQLFGTSQTFDAPAVPTAIPESYVPEIFLLTFEKIKQIKQKHAAFKWCICFPDSGSTESANVVSMIFMLILA